MLQLWTEKYRPKTLDEYVWRDTAQQEQVLQWLQQDQLPNVMFSGGPGTGKTALAQLLLRLLKIHSADILELNASRDRNVDVLQARIINFITTWSIGEYNCKYVMLNEADYISQFAQAMLRDVLERYAETARFILTLNYPHKIIPAIHSRCQGFHFTALDKDQFIVRAVSILDSEAIEFDDDLLMDFIGASYPDLRKCINFLQQNSREGKLHRPTTQEHGSADYLIQVVDLFKRGEFLKARKLIVDHTQSEQYDDVYRFLYENLELWGDSEEKQTDALLIIRKGLVNHTTCGDSEINLSATIAELTRLRKG